jgi:hypothetical protein
MKAIFMFVILFSSIQAKACSDFMWDWKERDWIEGSQKIYYGIVVSMSLDKESINDGETDPLFNVIALRGEQHITFKVFETFKGSPKKLVKVVLPECTGGVTEFGNTGLLFKVGKVWHIMPDVGNWESTISKNIIGKLSKLRKSSIYTNP